MFIHVWHLVLVDDQFRLAGRSHCLRSLFLIKKSVSVENKNLHLAGGATVTMSTY